MPSSFNFAVSQRPAPRRKYRPAGQTSHRLKVPVIATQFTNQPEELKCLVYAPVSDQLRTILGTISDTNVPEPHFATLKMKVKHLSRFYLRLQASGFEISNVANFRFRHAKALIEMWRRDGCPTTHMFKRWSLLLFWVRILGKPNMLDPLKYSTGIFIKSPMQSNASSSPSHTRTFKLTGSTHV